jgi:hypothetical protein
LSRVLKGRWAGPGLEPDRKTFPLRRGAAPAEIIAIGEATAANPPPFVQLDVELI